MIKNSDMNQSKWRESDDRSNATDKYVDDLTRK